MIRVAIIDDHPVMRDGTADLLSREADVDVVAVGHTVAEARALLSADIDVLLLDVRLGDESGLAALDGHNSSVAVIVLTAYELPQYANAALQLGAAGFALKTAPLADLVGAIRVVASGGVSFAIRPTTAVPFTDRELDVLRALAGGRSNDEISVALHITVATVETHLRRMFARAGVASRTELALRAVREGWLDIPRIRA